LNQLNSWHLNNQLKEHSQEQSHHQLLKGQQPQNKKYYQEPGDSLNAEKKVRLIMQECPFECLCSLMEMLGIMQENKQWEGAGRER